MIDVYYVVALEKSHYIEVYLIVKYIVEGVYVIDNIYGLVNNEKLEIYCNYRYFYNICYILGSVFVKMTQCKLARLNSPYLTQGRNYPKIKVHYKWYPYNIDESPKGQCDFFIDRLTWNNGTLKMVRHNCLHYLGHGKDHSYDESVIETHNKSMNDVGIVLAWMTHMRGEFNELW